MFFCVAMSRCVVGVHRVVIGVHCGHCVVNVHYVIEGDHHVVYWCFVLLMFIVFPTIGF